MLACMHTARVNACCIRFHTSRAALLLAESLHHVGTTLRIGLTMLAVVEPSIPRPPEQDCTSVCQTMEQAACEELVPTGLTFGSNALTTAAAPPPRSPMRPGVQMPRVAFACPPSGRRPLKPAPVMPNYPLAVPRLLQGTATVALVWNSHQLCSCVDNLVLRFLIVSSCDPAILWGLRDSDFLLCPALTLGTRALTSL